MTSLPLTHNHDIFQKHTHSRIHMDIGDSKDTSFLYSPLQTLHNLLEVFEFSNFEIKYAADSDADTEYIKLTGKQLQTAIEMHIFSCYCNGESVGPPPF